MSNSPSPSSFPERTDTDNDQVSERLGLHRQLLSKLVHSEALTGRDIDSAYAQEAQPDTNAEHHPRLAGLARARARPRAARAGGDLRYRACALRSSASAVV